MIRHTSRAVGGALALAVTLAACGGGGSSGVTPSALQPQPVLTNPNLAPATFQYGQAMLRGLARTGTITKGAMSVQVLVNMQNAAGLVSAAQAASDPRSGSYRHWLTPQQIGAQYGASTSNYTSVANYFTANGLHVAGWPQRETLTVSGSIANMQKAFGTGFGTYTFEGRQVVGPTGTPHFASTLPVTAVLGLVSARPQHTFFIHGSSASFYGYAPQQIATGFDYSGAWNSGFTGTGINVGIIGTGPILSNNSQPDPDTAALATYWHASMGTVTQIAASPQPASTPNGQTGTSLVDSYASFLATPPPMTAPCQGSPNFAQTDLTTCNPADGEAQLDTESIASLAPGASTLFYLAYWNLCQNNTTLAVYAPPCTGSDTNYQEEGIDLTDDEIQQAIADNRADAISMSFGEPENIAAAFDYIGPAATPGVGQIEMSSLALEGIAVFASSGDNGAWDCQDPNTGAFLGTACVNYPASDPSVVGVGGVNIPLDENGNLTGQISAWADNTTEGGNGSFENNVGSGGGVSSVFTSPAWQADTTGASMREIPDISLDADPLSGPSIAQNSAFSGYQELYASGGTSAAAPESAAQWGLVLQACKASATCNKGGATGYRLGNPAPLFYAIYGKSNPLATGSYTSAFVPELSYAGTFYDVIYGNNQAIPPNSTPAPATTPSGYNSGPGYDQVTGIGAPFTGHLIQAVTGTKTP